jgi:hypothetical protein
MKKGSEIVVRGGRPMSPEKFAESKKIRTRVLKLRDDLAVGYFEMGRLLFRVSKDHTYRHWNGPDGKPYENFKDYVEKEVEFKFRKARYLVSIWRWLAEDLDNPEITEKVLQLGWTKAAMLVGLVNAKNVDKWIEKARGMGIKELSDARRMALEAASEARRPTHNVTPTSVPKTTLTGEPSVQGETLSLPLPVSDASEQEETVGVDPLSKEEEKEVRTRWTILLNEEQRQNVESATDTAGLMAEVANDGKGFLLDFVATSFLAMYGGTVGNNDKEHKVNFRNSVLRAAEASLGVNLVAFDKATNRPLFGEKTIDRILEEED